MKYNVEMDVADWLLPGKKVEWLTPKLGRILPYKVPVVVERIESKAFIDSTGFRIKPGIVVIQMESGQTTHIPYEGALNGTLTPSDKDNK